MKRFLPLKLRQLFARKNRPDFAPVEESIFLPGDDSFRQMTFAFAVIALAAKLSQVDGAIGKKEFLAFCDLFPLPGEERDKTQRLFAMACKDSLGMAHYAQQIVQLFPGRSALMQELVSRYCKIALSDGPATPPERQWLRELSDLLGVSREAVNRMLAPDDAPASGDPYRVLGVTRKATPEEIKSAYRRRIRELHPDSLAARGYKPEEIAEADGLLASVNAAYGAIAAKRKMK